VQAALASAASFAAGAIVPLGVAAIAPFAYVSIAVVGISIVLLAILGGFGARTGNAPVARAVTRVVLLGAAAMLVTIGIGRLVGASI